MKVRIGVCEGQREGQNGVALQRCFWGSAFSDVIAGGGFTGLFWGVCVEVKGVKVNFMVPLFVSELRPRLGEINLTFTTFTTFTPFTHCT